MAIAKITEIQASSKKGFDDAVKAGIARADRTLRNISGAWVKSQKVKVEKGKITEYRVLMKVSFILADKGGKGDKDDR
jgi:dodecin